MSMNRTRQLLARLSHTDTHTRPFWQQWSENIAQSWRLRPSYLSWMKFSKGEETTFHWIESRTLTGIENRFFVSSFPFSSGVHPLLAPHLRQASDRTRLKYRTVRDCPSRTWLGWTRLGSGAEALCSHRYMRLEYSSGSKGKNRTSNTSQMAYNPVPFEFGFRAVLPRSYCSRRLTRVRWGWAKWISSTLPRICLQSSYITSLSCIACNLNSGQIYLTAIRRDCSHVVLTFTAIFQAFPTHAWIQWTRGYIYLCGFTLKPPCIGKFVRWFPSKPHQPTNWSCVVCHF